MAAQPWIGHGAPERDAPAAAPPADAGDDDFGPDLDETDEAYIREARTLPDDSDSEEDATVALLVDRVREASEGLYAHGAALRDEAHHASVAESPRAAAALQGVWKQHSECVWALIRLDRSLTHPRRRADPIAPHEWPALRAAVAALGRATQVLRQAVGLLQGALARSQLGMAPSGHFGDLDVAPPTPTDEATGPPTKAQVEDALYQLRQHTMVLGALVDNLVAVAKSVGLPMPTGDRGAAGGGGGDGSGEPSYTAALVARLAGTLTPLQATTAAVVGGVVGGAVAGPLGLFIGIKGSLLLATVAVGTVVGATGAAKLATQRSAGHVPALPPPPPPADEHAHQD